MDEAIENLTGASLNMSDLAERSNLSFIHILILSLRLLPNSLRTRSFLVSLGSTSPDLNGFINVTMLNQVLSEQGLPPVQG